MKLKITVGLVFVVLMLSGQGYSAPRIFYSNTFETAESINDFVIYGEEFVDYSPPPLNEVRVDSGQLTIETDYLKPNGPGTNPTLTGRALLMMNADESGEIGVFRTILDQNTGIVTWSINLSNQDGMYNNSFQFVLVSTEEDAFNVTAKGYCFLGGGMVGDRMGIRRFDVGMGGGGDMLIDVMNGLGTLPDKGSFKITYDPNNNEWTLYGEIAQEYVDPPTVSTFLGSTIDSTYTNIEAAYIGICGSTTGVNYFDNILITVEDTDEGSTEEGRGEEGSGGCFILTIIGSSN